MIAAPPGCGVQVFACPRLPDLTRITRTVVPVPAVSEAERGREGTDGRTPLDLK